MARQSGCSTVTIADVDQGRVDFAVAKGFATHGYVVDRAPHTSSNSSPMYSPSSSGTSTPLNGVMTPASALSMQSQFDYAKSLAADMLSLTSAASNPSFIGGIDDADEDDGVDITFECTGKEVCMHTSLYATRAGGRVIMVGMGTPVQTLPMSVAHLREIDILGIFRYANTYATGIRLLCARERQAKAGLAAPGAGGLILPCLDEMVTHRFKGLENAHRAFELASRTVDDEGRLVLKVVIET
jgi:L-iditol 2-dehydrogenase